MADKTDIWMPLYSGPWLIPPAVETDRQLEELLTDEDLERVS